MGGTSLKWLPKDEKDRRISIYSDYLSLFDNLSYVSSEAMDELCMWVTGYDKTERALFTNNKAISYSGKRPIGINGINIPIARADFRLPFTRSMVFPLPGSPHSTVQFKPIFISNLFLIVTSVVSAALVMSNCVFRSPVLTQDA